MSLKEEFDYLGERPAEITARLMGAQMFAQFLLKGYSALRSHGVDFMKLPEWSRMNEDLDLARRTVPTKALAAITKVFATLEHSLDAAIRRSQFRLHNTKS